MLLPVGGMREEQRLRQDSWGEVDCQLVRWTKRQHSATNLLRSSGVQRLLNRRRVIWVPALNLFLNFSGLRMTSFPVVICFQRGEGLDGVPVYRCGDPDPGLSAWPGWTESTWSNLANLWAESLPIPFSPVYRR